MEETETTGERPSRADELRLIEAARQGDRQAFGRLYGVYCRALVGFVMAHSSADGAEAEDIAQEMWTAALEGIGQSAAEGGFDPGRGASFYTFIINRYPKYLEHPRRPAPLLPRATDDSDGPGEPVGPAPRPDQILEAEEGLALKSTAFTELFRLTFLCGGYPHRQLAFAYSKLIYGQPSNRGIEGDPARLDREHGSRPLRDLAADFAGHYERLSELPPIEHPRILSFLRPLCSRLDLSVGRLMENDSASRKQHEDLLGRKAGRTCTRDYYAGKGGFTAAIPDWCYKVERRVREILRVKGESSGRQRPDMAEAETREGVARHQFCRRCVVRHVPPCSV